MFTGLRYQSVPIAGNHLRRVAQHLLHPFPVIPWVLCHWSRRSAACLVHRTRIDA